MLKSFHVKHFMKLPLGTKAVLFDMDGVIFNTEDLAHNVFAKLSLEYGTKFEEADHKAILGTAQSIWSNYFVEKWQLSISSEEFASLFWLLLRKEADLNLNMMPGFLKFIQELRENSVSTALVTSTPRVNADPLLKKFVLHELFDVIVTGEEIHHGKPSPEPYLLAVQRLNLDSRECAVIEDAISGVKSAKAAGCYVIAIPTVHAFGLDYSEADKVIQNFDELY